MKIEFSFLFTSSESEVNMKIQRGHRIGWYIQTPGRALMGGSHRGPHNTWDLANYAHLLP